MFSASASPYRPLLVIDELLSPADRADFDDMADRAPPDVRRIKHKKGISQMQLLIPFVQRRSRSMIRTWCLGGAGSGARARILRNTRWQLIRTVQTMSTGELRIGGVVRRPLVLGFG